jgi:hypothetical protein
LKQGSSFVQNESFEHFEKPRRQKLSGLRFHLIIRPRRWFDLIKGLASFDHRQQSNLIMAPDPRANQSLTKIRAFTSFRARQIKKRESSSGGSSQLMRRHPQCGAGLR